MTATNQDTTRGFLPPQTTTTTTGNHPHDHLPGFTTLLLPNKSPTSTSYDVVSCTTTQDSQHHQLLVATSLSHAIFKLREALAAATTTTGNTTHKPNSGNYQSDMIASCLYDQHHTQKTTGIRNPSRRTTLPDSISTGPHDQQQKTTAKKPPLTGVKTVCLDRSQESPHIKRMKKMEEMVKEMENKCLQFKSESESPDYVQRHNNSSKVIVEQDEVREESVRFKRLNDGSTSIRLSCSCGKSFEMLHDHNGSFYRLM